MGRRVPRRPIWGYAVCLCPIKGTPGLNEYILKAVDSSHMIVSCKCFSIHHLFRDAQGAGFAVFNVIMHAIAWLARVYNRPQKALGLSCYTVHTDSLYYS